MTSTLHRCDSSVASLLRCRDLRCSTRESHRGPTPKWTPDGSGCHRISQLLYFSCELARMHEPAEGGDDGGLRATDIRHLLVVLPAAAETAIQRDELVIRGGLGLNVFDLD